MSVLKIIINFVFTLFSIIIIGYLLLMTSEKLFPSMGWGNPFMEFKILGYVPTFFLMLISTIYVHFIMSKKAIKMVSGIFLFVGSLGLICIVSLSGMVELCLAIVAVTLLMSLVAVGHFFINYSISLYYNKTWK